MKIHVCRVRDAKKIRRRICGGNQRILSKQSG